MLRKSGRAKRCLSVACCIWRMDQREGARGGRSTHTRALRVSQTLQMSARPQLYKLQATSERPLAGRSFPPSERNVLETHPFTSNLSSPVQASLVPNDSAYRASPGRNINPVAATDSGTLARCSLQSNPSRGRRGHSGDRRFPTRQELKVYLI